MLSKNTFEKCISNLCYFGGVSIDPTKNSLLYKMMQNDFDDQEFKDICYDICKTEDLYNKYPIPKMFYDRKGCADEDVFVSLDSGSIEITDEAQRCLDHMTESQYQRMFSWMKSHVDGKTMKKSALSKIVIGFGSSPEQKHEDYVGLSEIKQLLSDHESEVANG